MELDKYISDLVSHQFPAFYEAEGQNFIAFVRGYYEWMEQSGYTINASKSLMDYKDIDTTVDQFISDFRNEYLVNFPAVTEADPRFIVKHIKDFYMSKGSTRGMQLLFRLLFDDDIEVYYPGADVLKPSDGIWTIPHYLEVEHNSRSATFVGQQITGSKSGATAFVESVHTRVVHQRLIDVLNISGAQGEFLFNELVTNDGNLFNAPKITGSLTDINIVDGGANNKVGDVFTVYSSTSGVKGQVRVTSTFDGTGRVNFKLVDGGYGYTLNPTQVRVSNTVLTYTSNATPYYTVLERISQPLISINYTVSTPSNPNTQSLYLTSVTGYSSGSVVANGLVAVIPGAANTFIINTTNGDFTTATSICTPGNTIQFTAYTYTNVTATGIVTGSNSTAVGLHNISGTFYSNGAMIVDSANQQSNVISISTGSGANFAVGSIVDTESIFLFTDFISGNNRGFVPYLNMVISGGNSNVILTSATGGITCNTISKIVTGSSTTFTSQVAVGYGLYVYPGNTYIGTVNAVTNNTSLVLSSNALTNASSNAFYYNAGQYGFPKNTSAGYNSVISSALNSNTFTIGTIASLSAINPGTNYNINPFVLVRNDYVAGYNRKNILLQLGSDKTGIFALGDTVSQTIGNPSTITSYNANTGAFTVGEGVTQSNGSVNAYATVYSTNATSLVLNNTRGIFFTNTAGGQHLVGLQSGATANISSVSTSTVPTLATGTIVNLPNSTFIELRRDSFNTSFVVGSQVSSTSGGAATVLYQTQNDNSLALGNNAIVSGNVSTARGIANTVEVMYSGIGHQPGDVIELVSNTNPFAITGTANVINQGVGLGYWKNTKGMLNSDKYIADGNYYQDFSYEIQSRLSLNKYADILRKLAHVAGTRMYGKVLISSSEIRSVVPEATSGIYYN